MTFTWYTPAPKATGNALRSRRRTSGVSFGHGIRSHTPSLPQLPISQRN
jgi:hypothetical protein